MATQTRDHRYLFTVAALLAFAIAHVVFGSMAEIEVNKKPLLAAINKNLRDAFSSPVGNLMLLAPFFVLAWRGHRLAVCRSLTSGMLLFIAGAIILCGLFYKGHFHAEHALQMKRWTAAALSIGLIPFYAIPVVVLISLIGLWLQKKSASGPKQNT